MNLKSRTQYELLIMNNNHILYLYAIYTLYILHMMIVLTRIVKTSTLSRESTLIQWNRHS